MTCQYMFCSDRRIKPVLRIHERSQIVPDRSLVPADRGIPLSIGCWRMSAFCAVDEGDAIEAARIRALSIRSAASAVAAWNVYFFNLVPSSI